MPAAKTKKRRARRIGEQTRRKLPTKSDEFTDDHRRFMDLRTEGKSNTYIAKTLGVDRSTITRWWNHDPFRSRITSHWERASKPAGALACYVKIKTLFELLRRLEVASELSISELTGILKTVKEDSATSINITTDLSGLDLRGLANRARAESQETERFAALVDPQSSLGQDIAAFSRPGSVPATEDSEA
jgi:hypothetical protein